MKKFGTRVFFLLYFCLIGLSFLSFEASKIAYVFFTVSFAVLIYCGVCRSSSYFAKFTSILLFLGFWLKMAVHNIFLYDYMEPVGAFTFAPAELNEVVVVAGIGALVLSGVILVAESLFEKLAVYTRDLSIPKWYSKKRWLAWTVVLTGLLLVAGANVIYGIQQSGMLPKTILIWPLNAVVYVSLAIYFICVFCVLINWDFFIKGEVGFNISSSVFDGVVAGVSLISRATYLFHVAPFVYLVLFDSKIKNRIEFRKKIAFLATSVVGFVAAITLVTFARNIYFYKLDYGVNEPAVNQESGTASKRNDNVRNIPGQVIYTLKGLIIDRWIGIEGLMATVAVPDKDTGLFKAILIENPKLNKDIIFNKIAKSSYVNNPQGFQFSSIPGPMALFYLSSNTVTFCILLGGCFLIFLLLELAVAYFFNNIFLSSVYALHIATIFTQIGIAPLGLIKHLILNFMFFVFLFLICRKAETNKFPAEVINF